MIDHKISAEYQRKVQDFVDQNVYYCVSSLCAAILPDMLEEGEYTEEAMNLLGCRPSFAVIDENGDGVLEVQSEDEAQEWIDECVEPEKWEIEERFQEIFEHWIVSSYFGDQLRIKGEVIESIHDVLIWGRTTTGQSIMLDGVVQEIYEQTKSN